MFQPMRKQRATSLVVVVASLGIYYVLQEVAGLWQGQDLLSYTLKIKSVNHRFLDIQLRLPSGLDALEMELRRLLKEHLVRGHVEVMLSVDRSAQQVAGFNRELVSGYIAAFNAARDSALARTVAPAALTRSNRALMQVERSLTRPEGLKTRPWFRNLIYVADENNGYANMVMPSINEAIRAGDESLARSEVADLAARFDRAAQAVADARTAIQGR